MGDTFDRLASLFESVEIIEAELVTGDVERCVVSALERLGNSRSTDELSIICKVHAICMLWACAAPNMSMSGTPSPDLTELNTNSAQAAI